jgi:hypothetical protein
MSNKCELEPREIVAHWQITSDSYKKESPKEEGLKKKSVSKKTNVLIIKIK